MATANTSFQITHCHYHRLDPAAFPEPALFKVYKGGALVAVVREPADGPLVGEPVPLKNYRVDCRAAETDLKEALQAYFWDRTFAYFENAAWTWNDNGTYQEMPWRGREDDA